MRALESNEKIIEKNIFNKTIRMTEDGKFIIKSETALKMYIGALLYLVISLILYHCSM